MLLHHPASRKIDNRNMAAAAGTLPPHLSVIHVSVMIPGVSYWGQNLRVASSGSASGRARIKEPAQGPGGCHDAEQDDHNQENSAKVAKLGLTS
jgi:hypothetical protein